MTAKYRTNFSFLLNITIWHQCDICKSSNISCALGIECSEEFSSPPTTYQRKLNCNHLKLQHLLKPRITNPETISTFICTLCKSLYKPKIMCLFATKARVTSSSSSNNGTRTWPVTSLGRFQVWTIIEQFSTHSQVKNYQFKSQFYNSSTICHGNIFWDWLAKTCGNPGGS